MKPPPPPPNTGAPGTRPPQIIPSVGVSRVAAPRRGESIAVFIDLDNTNASRDNVEELFSILTGRGHIAHGRLYGYTDDRVNDFAELVSEYRLDTIGMMRFKQDHSVVDARLVLDAIRITSINRFDTVFVWAGVGDLVPLFSGLKELGVKTATVDIRDFDVDNKFVDQRIKLYSPFKGVINDTKRKKAREAATAKETPAPDTQEMTTPGPKASIAPGAGLPAFLGDYVPPELPRKEGAPGIGEIQNPTTIFDQMDDGPTEEDFAFAAAQILMEFEAEQRKENYMQDFADLNIVNEDTGKREEVQSAHRDKIELTGEKEEHVVKVIRPDLLEQKVQTEAGQEIEPETNKASLDDALGDMSFDIGPSVTPAPPNPTPSPPPVVPNPPVLPPSPIPVKPPVPPPPPMPQPAIPSPQPPISTPPPQPPRPPAPPPRPVLASMPPRPPVPPPPPVVPRL